MSLRRYDLEASLRAAFAVLADTGIGVIDVGSRGGLHPVFREVAPLVNAVGFEPDREECRRLNELRDLGVSYRSSIFLPFGLASEDGHRILHLCRSRGTSSLYRPNRAFLERFPDPERFDVEREVRVAVRALDNVLSDPAIPRPARIDFVKVDTQASELDVLRGAPQTLGDQVVALEVEVEFAELYESGCLFRDVDALLARHGFTLFKLRRHDWVRKTFTERPQLTSGQLVFGDALYLRDPLNHRSAWAPRDRHQAEALVLIAILYDLHDFAWEVISAPAISEQLDPANIKRYIAQRSAGLAPRWSRVQTVRHLLGSVRTAAKAVRRFRRYDSHWARGDSHFYSRTPSS